MNINKSGTINTFNIYIQNADIQSKNTKNKSINITKDKIEISDEAKKMIDMNNDDRAIKIEKIKESINNGSYEIDYNNLAKKILDKMRG